MKLPLDLSGRMPGSTDELAKWGSMTFMCTMMSNLMPSLASMDDRELVANVTGMVLLVVTIVVNVLIQIKTGVVLNFFDNYVYIGVMLFLLVIMISSALTIPTSKKILEFKYQRVQKTSSDVHPQLTRRLRVEELIQYVRKYWMMAGTSSPQFVMITTPLCSAAGIACVPAVALYYYFFVLIWADLEGIAYLDFGSDYEWSIVVIVVIQSIGILVGNIAPLFRCFAALSFKLSLKWVKKHTKVCEVEKYWTQKLLEWKQIPLAFPLSGRISKALVYNFYHLILNLCIICQKLIVVSCKIVGLIPLGTVIIGVFCVNRCKSLKANFFLMPVASNRDTNQDVENYVLQLQDEMELGRRTLGSFSNSANRSIQKGEKQLPTNLLKLIEQCTGFEGVVKFDSENIQGLIWVTFPNSWSLPIVTLTCIAITLPNISQESVDDLFRGVCESLSYTLLVEESLNNVGEYKKIQKATMALRQEVEVNYKWLGNTLQRNSYKEKNPKEILEWFADKAKDIAVEMNEHINEEPFDSYCERLVVADSMYRVTQTIMVNYPGDIENGRGEQLFYLLSSMIVDIAVACFTNLPRVIVMKCQEDAIEKREASVGAAAELLGSTKTIIEKVDACEVPNLDPEKMAFIDEWRVHLKQSIP
ncbi:uncharacterized protein LOC112528559 [Cynara cardunculus var. scolymus]|uniref:uncharacterized protein LOC112528559 n=1 Tax=Cynara cardunculus var. scolymus TaxID=59895 RepID=UPI000D623831|nr:uncharacterized protein LOC112528559 [Cynara cardunculus var. scolymus]